eukprot:411957-Lingulodinium_polyedra.AAC.1
MHAPLSIPTQPLHWIPGAPRQLPIGLHCSALRAPARPHGCLHMSSHAGRTACNLVEPGPAGNGQLGP